VRRSANVAPSLVWAWPRRASEARSRPARLCCLAGTSRRGRGRRGVGGHPRAPRTRQPCAPDRLPGRPVLLGFFRALLRRDTCPRALIVGAQPAHEPALFLRCLPTATGSAWVTSTNWPKQHLASFAVRAFIRFPMLLLASCDECGRICNSEQDRRGGDPEKSPAGGEAPPLCRQHRIAAGEDPCLSASYRNRDRKSRLSRINDARRLRSSTASVVKPL
jgi:hypothetical protein